MAVGTNSDRRRPSAAGRLRWVAVLVLVGVLVMPGVAWGSDDVIPDSTMTPGAPYVPVGVSTQWTVQWFTEVDSVSVTWGDGSSTNYPGGPSGTARMISHVWSSAVDDSQIRVSINRSNGFVEVMTDKIDSFSPSLVGPRGVGGGSAVSPIPIGDTVEFELLGTPPNAADLLWFGKDGSWTGVERRDRLFTASWPTATHSARVGIRMTRPYWQGAYERWWSVSVFDPSATTTTTTVVHDTTTTSSTTTTVASGDTTTTTQSPTTTLDAADATTTTAGGSTAVDEGVDDPIIGVEEEPGADGSDEDEEEPQLVFDRGAPFLLASDGGSSGGGGDGGLPIVGILAIIGGLGAAALFGTRAVRATKRPGAFAENMAVRTPRDTRRLRLDGANLANLAGVGVSLGIVVLGVLGMFGAGSIPASASDPIDLVEQATASPQFIRETSFDDLGSVGREFVITRAGTPQRLDAYLEESRIDTEDRFGELLDEGTQEFLASEPVVEQTVIQLEDRFVVDRSVLVDIGPGACESSEAPDALLELCWNLAGGEMDAETDDAVAEIRGNLAAAAGTVEVAPGVTVADARRLSDRELLRMLLNSGKKRVRHISVLPSVEPDPTAPLASLVAFESPLTSLGVGASAGIADDPGPEPIEFGDGATTEPTKYFLTGFTLGEDIQDHWEYEISEETWLTDRYFVRFEYRLGYGFGLRWPFSVDVTHERTDSSSANVGVRVAPVNVGADGSPAYGAVGLASGKTFAGKEFVLEVHAGCRLVASIPGPNIAQDCPEVSFSESRDIDPVLGGAKSNLKEFWVSGKTTGLWFDAGVADASLDVGVSVDATGGTFSMNVDPDNATVGGLDGALRFGSAKERTFTLQRNGGLTGGIALSDPRSSFEIKLSPAFRAKVGIDVGVYDNSWTLGPWHVPIGFSLATIPLPHHSGTVGSHTFDVFGPGFDVQPPTAPPSAGILDD